jgi:cytochrome c553
MLTRSAFWALLLWAPLLAQAAGNAQAEFRKAVALKPDMERGRELFDRCADCHGANGGGTTDGAIPRIAGQYRRVLVRQLVDYRRGTRWDARMEGVATSHQVIPELQDIADVAGYVSQMRRDGARGLGDGAHVQRGESLYRRGCASCHGETGEGKESKDIPRLAGQHAPYLGRQIHDAVDGRRPLLALTHRGRFETLEFEDILGLTDYLARIGWQEDATPSVPPR